MRPGNLTMVLVTAAYLVGSDFFFSCFFFGIGDLGQVTWLTLAAMDTDELRTPYPIPLMTAT